MDCTKGYKGILCNECSDGYYKIGLYICGKCSSTGIDILKFLGIILF